MIKEKSLFRAKKRQNSLDIFNYEDNTSSLSNLKLKPSQKHYFQIKQKSNKKREALLNSNKKFVNSMHSIETYRAHQATSAKKVIQSNNASNHRRILSHRKLISVSEMENKQTKDIVKTERRNIRTLQPTSQQNRKKPTKQLQFTNKSQKRQNNKQLPTNTAVTASYGLRSKGSRMNIMQQIYGNGTKIRSKRLYSMQSQSSKTLQASSRPGSKKALHPFHNKFTTKYRNDRLNTIDDNYNRCSSNVEQPATIKKGCGQSSKSSDSLLLKKNKQSIIKGCIQHLQGVLRQITQKEEEKSHIHQQQNQHNSCSSRSISSCNQLKKRISAESVQKQNERIIERIMTAAQGNGNMIMATNRAALDELTEMIINQNTINPKQVVARTNENHIHFQQPNNLIRMQTSSTHQEAKKYNTKAENSSYNSKKYYASQIEAKEKQRQGAEQIQLEMQLLNAKEQHNQQNQNQQNFRMYLDQIKKDKQAIIATSRGKEHQQQKSILMMKGRKNPKKYEKKKHTSSVSRLMADDLNLQQIEGLTTRINNKICCNDQETDKPGLLNLKQMFNNKNVNVNDNYNAKKYEHSNRKRRTISSVIDDTATIVSRKSIIDDENHHDSMMEYCQQSREQSQSKPKKAKKLKLQRYQNKENQRNREMIVQCSSIEQINQSSFISDAGKQTLMKQFDKKINIGSLKRQDNRGSSKKGLYKVKANFPNDFF